ncbi:9820_t:CDS:1, partial [Scutellospora calospora]
MLSIVNAIPHQLHKRTTNFGKCTLPPKAPTPDLLTVTISPDPVVPGKNDTFTVNGKLTKPITSSDELVIVFANTSGIIGDIFRTKLPTGTVKVSVTENVPVPFSLPSDYRIGVAIVDPSFEPPDVKACAVAFVGSPPPSHDAL